MAAVAPAKVKLSGPAELIGVIPHLIGFQPQNSVVLVNMKDNKVGLIQRIDIPPAEHAAEAAQHMIEPMLRDGPDQVILLGYEDVEDDALLLLADLKAAIPADIRILEAVIVRDGRWYSLTCTETCCPPEGTLIPDTPPAAAEFIGHGSNPAPSREALSARLEATAEAVGALETDASEMPEHHGLLVETGRDVWAKVLANEPLTSLEIAYAAFALRDVNFRDALIAHMCPGLLPEDLIDSETLLLTADLPEVQGDETVIDSLVELCAGIKDSEAAPALTILANLAWDRGDGALTRIALERALRCEPTYRLAQLLEQMVDLAIRPNVRHG